MRFVGRGCWEDRLPIHRLADHVFGSRKRFRWLHGEDRRRGHEPNSGARGPAHVALHQKRSSLGRNEHRHVVGRLPGIALLPVADPHRFAPGLWRSANGD